jgi:hypothetical protein
LNSLTLADHSTPLIDVICRRSIGVISPYTLTCGGFNAASMLDLLDHRGSCEVLQRRLPKPAVHSSR